MNLEAIRLINKQREITGTHAASDYARAVELPRLFSPMEVSFVLHCYYSPVPYQEPISSALASSIKMFIENDIIKTKGDGLTYQVTDRGMAWVELLLRVQFPKQAWVDENGKIIDNHYCS